MPPALRRRSRAKGVLDERRNRLVPAAQALLNCDDPLCSLCATCIHHLRDALGMEDRHTPKPTRGPRDPFEGFR